MQRISIPGTQVYRLGDLALGAYAEFNGSVTIAEESCSRDTSSKALEHCGSLSDQRTLYEIGLASKLGRTSHLPSAARAAGAAVYENLARPHFMLCADACDYFRTRHAVTCPAEGRKVRWIQYPDGFERRGSEWHVRLGEKSMEFWVDLPPTGFVLMTSSGAYRPDTGTPFTTSPDRETAVDSWLQRGYDRNLITPEVSLFQAMPPDQQGIAAVVHLWAPVGAFKKLGYFYLQADVNPETALNTQELNTTDVSIIRNKSPPVAGGVSEFASGPRTL